MQKSKHGAAYEAVRFIYDHSPRRSWQRLNAALAETLIAAIRAHLKFKEDDFAAMRADMNGHYWMGNSIGSVCGERFYIYAVNVDHTPACLSFEKYANRPPALWVEDVKTPARLCIGSCFTWEGLRVEVTNMTDEHLIACHYSNRVEHHAEAKVGDGLYFDSVYRRIDSIKKGSTGGIILRLGDALEDNRTPSKRFTIPYDALLAKRKGFDAARKDALAKIAAADNEARLNAIVAEGSTLKWRPFDISELIAAIRARRSALRDGGTR